MYTQTQTLPTTLPVSLTAPYRCHVTQNEMGMDWEPYDEFVAIPVGNLIDFAEDYDNVAAVARILASVKLEFPGEYDALMRDLREDTDILACPFALIGWLQAMGHVTLDTLLA